MAAPPCKTILDLEVWAGVNSKSHPPFILTRETRARQPQEENDIGRGRANNAGYPFSNKPEASATASNFIEPTCAETCHDLEPVPCMMP